MLEVYIHTKPAIFNIAHLSYVLLKENEFYPGYPPRWRMTNLFVLIFQKRILELFQQFLANVNQKIYIAIFL